MLLVLLLLSAKAGVRRKWRWDRWGQPLVLLKVVIPLLRSPQLRFRHRVLVPLLVLCDTERLAEAHGRRIRDDAALVVVRVDGTVRGVDECARLDARVRMCAALEGVSGFR